MINNLLKVLYGKELILYHPHRNLVPILNTKNRKNYIFLNPLIIWKLTGFVGRNKKLRYRLMYSLLTFLNPVYIIDINWTGKRRSLYLVWCNNNDRSYVVIQHGIYHGGIIKYVPEKYVKCNIFLVWGKHFKRMYEENNRGKEFLCISFGNPCFNVFDRSTFQYKKEPGNSILVAVSVIKGERLDSLYHMLKKLEAFGFEITIKEHSLQEQKGGRPIEGYKKVSGNLYEILQNQEYDIVITDVSSAMVDIIFFKNRAIYFSPEEEGSDLNDNIYRDFMNNMANDIDKIASYEDVLKYVDINAQENLLGYLVKTENASNDLAQVKKAKKETKFISA